MVTSPATLPATSTATSSATWRGTRTAPCPVPCRATSQVPSRGPCRVAVHIPVQVPSRITLQRTSRPTCRASWRRTREVPSPMVAPSSPGQGSDEEYAVATRRRWTSADGPRSPARQPRPSELKRALAALNPTRELERQFGVAVTQRGRRCPCHKRSP